MVFFIVTTLFSSNSIPTEVLFFQISQIHGFRELPKKKKRIIIKYIQKPIGTLESKISNRSTYTYNFKQISGLKKSFPGFQIFFSIQSNIG